MLRAGRCSVIGGTLVFAGLVLYAVGGTFLPSFMQRRLDIVAPIALFLFIGGVAVGVCLMRIAERQRDIMGESIPLTRRNVTL